MDKMYCAPGQITWSHRTVDSDHHDTTKNEWEARYRAAEDQPDVQIAVVSCARTAHNLGDYDTVRLDISVASFHGWVAANYSMVENKWETPDQAKAWVSEKWWLYLNELRAILGLA